MKRENRSAAMVLYLKKNKITIIFLGYRKYTWRIFRLPVWFTYWIHFWSFFDSKTSGAVKEIRNIFLTVYSLVFLKKWENIYENRVEKWFLYKWMPWPRGNSITCTRTTIPHNEILPWKFSSRHFQSIFADVSTKVW